VQYSSSGIKYKISDFFYAVVYFCPDITDRYYFKIADGGGGLLLNVGCSPEDGGCFETQIIIYQIT
jgi:hypothetical protein